MKVVPQVQPRALIDQVLLQAEKTIDAANQGNAVISKADYGRLPPYLRAVVDDFQSAGADRVKTGDILGTLRNTLEAGLAKSLKAGALQPGELVGDVQRLLQTSPLGVQALQMLADQVPLTAQRATQRARQALISADPGAFSQIAVLKTLQDAADAHAREEGNAPVAKQLKEVVQQRGKAMRKAADNAVKTAQAAAKADPNNAAVQQTLKNTLVAAQRVHEAVNPKSARVKTLQKEAAAVGVATRDETAQAQPFFARFLENQNRNRPVGERRTGDVTEKAPSDAEDAGADGGLAVTAKFPSDAEDGGAGNDGGIGAVTEKAPSDNEDGGVDGGIGAVTEKAPSDNEDGGVDDGGLMVTMKAPSDNEDGGSGGIGDMVTEKFPSDNEDGGVGDGAMVTMKLPSDNEDGGAGDDGPRIDDGGAVTTKFPSDAEDGGVDNPDDAVTAKFPSDNEDSGAGDGLLVTMKYPSDNEDGGAMRDAGGLLTEKYPSDAEDGGSDLE